MTTVFEQAQRFTEMWTDFASKVAAAGLSVDAGMTPPEAAQRMRQAVFSAMSQYADEFMRSPQFLELSRQSLEAATTFQQQLNDALTGIRHNLQGVARQDIDMLMLSVRHQEQRVLDAIEGLSEKLEALNERLAALEKQRERPSPRARQIRRSPQPRLAQRPGASNADAKRSGDVESLDAADGGRGSRSDAQNGADAGAAGDGEAVPE